MSKGLKFGLVSAGLTVVVATFWVLGCQSYEASRSTVPDEDSANGGTGSTAAPMRPAPIPTDRATKQASTGGQRGWWKLPHDERPYYSAYPGPGRRLTAIVPKELAGSFAMPDEELWIVQRPAEPAAEPGEDIPGSGELRAKLPSEEKEIPLPLKHTDVNASISAYIATVGVTQQ